MKDYTVIQGLMLLGSFLACLFSHAYAMWGDRGRMAAIAGQRFLPDRTDLRWPNLFFSALYSEKQHGALGTGTLRDHGGDGKASPKGKFSAAGDWLAPLIVWFLVITMGLAIVGFLLGER